MGRTSLEKDRKCSARFRKAAAKRTSSQQFPQSEPSIGQLRRSWPGKFLILETSPWDRGFDSGIAPQTPLDSDPLDLACVAVSPPHIPNQLAGQCVSLESTVTTPGRSSAWLERLLWEQEVARSNRVAPICKDPENTAFSGSFLFPAWWFSFAGAQSQSAATRGLCKTWMQPTWCLWERASHSVCGTDPNPSGCPLRAGSVADMKALVFRSRPRGFGIKQRT